MSSQDDEEKKVSIPRGRGRPPAVLDETMLFNLARIGCTYKEIADFFGVTAVTLTKRKEFQSIIREGHSEMKQSLRRKQLEVAMDGNPQMLIWLGKNILGQKDIQTIEHDVSVNQTQAREKLERALFANDGIVLEHEEFNDPEDDK